MARSVPRGMSIPWIGTTVWHAAHRMMRWEPDCRTSTQPLSRNIRRLWLLSYQSNQLDGTLSIQLDGTSFDIALLAT